MRGMPRGMLGKCPDTHRDPQGLRSARRPWCGRSHSPLKANNEEKGGKEELANTSLLGEDDDTLHFNFKST